MKWGQIFLSSMMMLMMTAHVEAREYLVTTTPQGQTLTITGEARDYSEAVSRRNAIGWVAANLLQAWDLVERLRVSNLMVASSIELSPDHSLIWPTGQWIECVMTDSSAYRARRIFTCGPEYALRVIELGRQSKRIPGDDLYRKQIKGIRYFGAPIYIALPNKKMTSPDGRTHWMGMNDIAYFRFVRVPVDSLNAVAERR